MSTETEAGLIWIHRDHLKSIAVALEAEGLQYLHCPEWDTCACFTVVPIGRRWRCPRHRREGVVP